MLNAIFVIGTLWLPSALSSVCVSQDSVFPNIRALGCESYFSCHDFVPHLHDCPDGYQFHYANLQCQPSDQVLCQWQRENFQQAYGAGGIPHEFYDRGYPPADGLIDPLGPPPIGFVDPLAAIDGSQNFPFPDGILPPPLVSGPLLQPPPVGFLPRAPMFPSSPGIDMSISVLARDLIDMLAPIAQSAFSQLSMLSIPSPFVGNGMNNNAGYNTRIGFGNTGMQSHIPEYYPDPFFGQYTTNPLPLFSTMNSIPTSGYIPGFADASTMGMSYPMLSIPSPFTGIGINNAGYNTRIGYGNTGMQSNIPEYYPDPFFGQYTTNPLPLFSTMNSIPTSGYIPGFADASTIGVPYPIFMNMNNIPKSGFNNAFQGMPLPISPFTNFQQSGYIPRITNQYSQNAMTTSFPGVSSNVPSLGVIGSLFPINLQQLGLGAAGQSLGQSGLGLNGITLNGQSFPQSFGGFPGFAGTQSMATGTNALGGSGLFSGIPGFGNFLNFTFPLLGSSGNVGFGGFGLGTPSSQSKLNGANFPVNFGINFPVGSTTPNSQFPSGLTNTQFGTVFNSPPLPVWNANTNQGSGVPINTAPYPVNVNNPNGNFVPMNSVPSGIFLGSTTYGSNPPTPLGFGNSGVSTAFPNQLFGNTPSGFANVPYNTNNVGYTSQTSLGSNAPSGSYSPPYPLFNTGSNTNPSTSNAPVPLGFASPNSGSSFGYQIPNTSGSSNNAYTPIVVKYQPNASGYVPNTSGYTPNTSGYVPNTNGYTPNTSGYVPNTSGYIPNTGGYVPNTSGYVPNTSGYVPNTSGYIPNTNGNVPNTSGYVPNTSGYVPNTSGYIPNTNGNVPNTSGYVPTGTGYVPSGNPTNIYPFNSNVNRSGSVVLGGFPGSSYNSNLYNPNSIALTSNTGTGQLYVPSYGSNIPNNAGTNTGYAPNYVPNNPSNTATSGTGFGVVYPSNSASVSKSGGFQGFELGTLRSNSDGVNPGTISKDRDFRSTPNDTSVANVSSTSGMSATVLNGNGTVSVSAG